MTPRRIHQIQRWLIRPRVWRLLGFLSTILGLLCYALSSSFNHLFGHWNASKIAAYCVFGTAVSLAILFAELWQSLRCLHFEAHMAFLNLTLTSIYSFFFDKAVKAKPDACILISYAAFAVTSLSLSRRNRSSFGFEVDLLYFFLGCLMVQLMKMSLWLGFAGVGFSYSLIILRSLSKNESPIQEYQPRNHVVVQVNSREAQGFGNALSSSVLTVQEELLPSAEERRWTDLAVANLLRCQLVKYLADKEDRIPAAVLNDRNFMMDELPSQVVKDLHENMKAMVKRGYEKVCSDRYSSWRREFLELAANELIAEEDGVDDKRRIKNWIKLSNVSLKILFPNERRLCDRIFSGFSSVADRSFAQVCSEMTTNLLTFADAFANGSRSTNHLPSVLQVFGELHDLIPEFESVFSDQCSVSLRAEAIATTKRLGETIRGMFMELEGLVRCDTEQADIPGGICPITVQVMNHLCTVGDSKFSSLSLEVTRIIELLENHLEAKSKTYTNPALILVFLMNNEGYILHKAKQYQLGNILGDDWVDRRIAKVRQSIEHYRISSWDEVLEFLKLGSNESVEPNAGEPETMEEKLNLFNMHFKEIWRDQSVRFVGGEEEIREEIRKITRNDHVITFMHK